MPQTDVLRGAYCPLIVPFRDGKIDYDTYGKLIERQIAEGTHGLLVNATSGEPTMLTLSVAQGNSLAAIGPMAKCHRRPVAKRSQDPAAPPTVTSTEAVTKERGDCMGGP